MGCLHDLADSLDDADVNVDPGDGDDEDRLPEPEEEHPMIPQTRGGLPDGINLVAEMPTGVIRRS